MTPDRESPGPPHAVGDHHPWRSSQAKRGPDGTRTVLGNESLHTGPAFSYEDLRSGPPAAIGPGLSSPCVTRGVCRESRRNGPVRWFPLRRLHLRFDEPLSGKPVKRVELQDPATSASACGAGHGRTVDMQAGARVRGAAPARDVRLRHDVSLFVNIIATPKGGTTGGFNFHPEASAAVEDNAASSGGTTSEKDDCAGSRQC